MATARKLPSGNYRVRVYVGNDENGKALYESFTAPTKREAERQAALYNGDRKRREADRRSGRICLAEAMDAYIETCKGAKLSPSTIVGYLSIRRTFGFLLSYNLSDIRAQDVQRAVNEWNKTVSPKTVKNRYTLLTAVLNANQVKYDFDVIKLPHAQKQEMVIPEDEDVQRLLFYYKQNNMPMYLAVLIASTLGLRRSEICALQWSDVDFEEKTLTINKALVMGDDKKYQYKGNKTDAGKRILTIADVVLGELEHYRQPSGRIVTITPNALTTNYIRSRDKFNVPGRFHDLRHYAASVMAALNIPEKYAVEFMGHATTDMLHRVYQHTMKKKRDSVYDAINAHSNNLVKGQEINY